MNILSAVLKHRVFLFAKYYEKEIKLPTNSIEHLYVELYKLLHMEYLKSLVEDL